VAGNQKFNLELEKGNGNGFGCRFVPHPALEIVLLRLDMIFFPDLTHHLAFSAISGFFGAGVAASLAILISL
jgi:hypothetical protein